MTRQILFVQSGGRHVHDGWDDKLVASLERELGDGYAVRYPRMPREDDPGYAAWRATLIGEFEALEDGAILVGHSLGGTILLHVLAEHPPGARLGGIFVLAAPFIGEGGWPSDDIEGDADLAERLPRGVPIRLYHGDADKTAPPAHLGRYAKAIPQAVAHTLKGRDHQLGSDLSEVALDIRTLG